MKPQSPTLLGAAIGCGLAFVASAGLTLLLIQAANPPSDAPPDDSSSQDTPKFLIPNPDTPRVDLNELLMLREAVSRHQAELSQVRREAQALQLQLQSMTQAVEQSRAELQQIRRDGQTLANCTDETNTLIDSIELKKPRALEMVGIGVKAMDFVRSQIDQDGACRRSRSIAQRFLQAAP